MFSSVKDIMNVCLGCVFMSLAFLLASCHNDPIALNPVASLNIQLSQKNEIGVIESKSDISTFDAFISIIYENDSSTFYGVFSKDDRLGFYVPDHTQSEIIYVSIGLPFCVHVAANYGSEILHAESDVMIIENDAVTVTIELGSGTINISPYTDLGLPSGNLWATCNFGANHPEEYGNYYQWIEIADIDMRENQCIPSEEDFEELSEYCTKTWTTLNNVNGYRLTGPNGNSIFLPAAGGKKFNIVYNDMSCGFYWLIDDYTENTDYAWGFLMDENNFEITSFSRSYAQTVRPVYKRN